jgi:hypothetical protein
MDCSITCSRLTDFTGWYHTGGNTLPSKLTKYALPKAKNGHTQTKRVEAEVEVIFRDLFTPESHLAKSEKRI